MRMCLVLLEGREKPCRSAGWEKTAYISVRERVSFRLRAVGKITFHAPEISLDAVQKIGQYKMESMAKEKAGTYGAEVQGWAQQALPRGGSCIESGNSSIHYGELDSLGRATGVDATITVDMVGTGTPAKSSIKPAGFGGQKAGHARGHLLGNQLGGAGDDPRNLTTLFQNPVNHPVMSSVEGSVRKAVEAGEVVQYSVKPIYEGNTLIPSGVTIKAEGDKGFYIYQTILNRK